MDETDLFSVHPTIPQQIEEEKTDEEEDEIQEEEAGPDEEEDEIQEEEAGPSTSRKRGRPRKGEQVPEKPVKIRRRGPQKAEATYKTSADYRGRRQTKIIRNRPRRACRHHCIVCED